MSDPLRRELLVQCSPAIAYRAFTEAVDTWWPTGHRRFAESALSIEPGVGGRFVEASPTGEEFLMGEVLLWEPPEMLVYTWYPGGHVGPTEVHLHFAPVRDNATRIRITHYEGESQLAALWEERVVIFGRAWDHLLPAFAAFVERVVAHS